MRFLVLALVTGVLLSSASALAHDVEEQGSDTKWTPPPADADADGLWDHIDECPEHPETRNGIEDDDGCPDARPPPSTLSAPWRADPRDPEPEEPATRRRSPVAMVLGILGTVAGGLLFFGAPLYVLGETSERDDSTVYVMLVSGAAGLAVSIPVLVYGARKERVPRRTALFAF